MTLLSRKNIDDLPPTLFSREYRWSYCYRLIGTCFLVWASKDRVRWAEIEIDLKEPIIKDTTFERVLDELPERIQEELLFYIDILS